MSGINFSQLATPRPPAGDLRATLTALANERGNAAVVPWLVLDGYHFDMAYQTSVRAAGCLLLVLDDAAHLPRYNADIIVNPSKHAEQLAYRVAAPSILLLGPCYALIRAEFRDGDRAESARVHPDRGRKVLVTLGGGDSDNTTAKIIAALQRVAIADLEARVIVGPLNPHIDNLKRQIAESRPRVSLETDVQDLASLMRWADLAISAAGGTCWELAYLGVPMVNVVVADNQRDIGAALDRAGVSVNLGWHHDLSIDAAARQVADLLGAPAQRARMSANGKALVDGRGVERIIAAMAEKSCARAA